MARKIVPIASVIIISLIVGVFFYETSSIDKKLMEETFVFDAVYLENEGYVEINFQDKSGSSQTVVLEILGMEESFQKTFDESRFMERVEFSGVPKHGWVIHPVTLVVQHDDFGKIGLKTEIHLPGEPAPPIIYSPL